MRHSAGRSAMLPGPFCAVRGNGDGARSFRGSTSSNSAYARWKARAVLAAIRIALMSHSNVFSATPGWRSGSHP